MFPRMKPTNERRVGASQANERRLHGALNSHWASAVSRRPLGAHASGHDAHHKTGSASPWSWGASVLHGGKVQTPRPQVCAAGAHQGPRKALT